MIQVTQGGAWDSDLAAEARRHQFGEILTAALNGETPPPAMPEETGPRVPRPNAAQGTSEGAMPALSPAAQFAELLTGLPYTDPNTVPGNRSSVSAAQAGQHAGWRST